MNSFELGYAMGLIVGDGSFTGSKNNPALQVKRHHLDIMPLIQLRLLFGGAIYGPYSHNDRVYNTWLLRGAELKNAIPILLEHLPPSARRDRFLAWLERYELPITGGFRVRPYVRRENSKRMA